jgi:deoxyribonucleoside regulator
MVIHNVQKSEKYLNYLSEVAMLYYEQELTQMEIAEKLSVSRSKVSRLLSECKERKIVTFQVKKIGKRSYELEQILKRKYDLKGAFILNDIQLLGEYAASYLEDVLHSSTRIGMSWGRSVSSVVQNLSHVSRTDGPKDIIVIQVVGGILSDSYQGQQMEAVIGMVDKLNAKGYYLQAPLYFDDVDLKEAFVKQPMISRVINVAKSADILLTGIGDMNDDSFSYMWKNYGYENFLPKLKKNDGVGFICGQCYTSEGKPLSNIFNNHIVGINLDQVKRIPKVIAVAGGKQKTQAVLGALKGGYIDVLFTDRECVSEFIF